MCRSLFSETKSGNEWSFHSSNQDLLKRHGNLLKLITKQSRVRPSWAGEPLVASDIWPRLPEQNSFRCTISMQIRTAQREYLAPIEPKQDAMLSVQEPNKNEKKKA